MINRSNEMSQPPTYTPIAVLYDETHRGRWDQTLSIASMGQVAHLYAHLEHHNPTTDGSFAICIAGGTGTFISNVSLLNLDLPFLC